MFLRLFIISLLVAFATVRGGRRRRQRNQPPTPLHFTHDQLKDLQDMYHDAIKTAKDQLAKEAAKHAKPNYQVLYVLVNPDKAPRPIGAQLEPTGASVPSPTGHYAMGDGSQLHPKAHQGFSGAPCHNSWEAFHHHHEQHPSPLSTIFY